MRKIFTERKPGFSLMEMMIVLLIVAIVAAATAPMITKKMARSSGAGGGPIGWHSMTDYGNAGRGSLIIGAKKTFANSKVSINSKNSDQPQIGFGSNGELTGILGVQPNGRIAFGGTGDNMAKASQDHATAIGSSAQANGEGSIALGNQAKADSQGAVAIGNLSSQVVNKYSFGTFNARNTSATHNEKSIRDWPAWNPKTNEYYRVDLLKINNINLDVIKNIKAESVDAAKNIAESNLLAAFQASGDARLQGFKTVMVYDSTVENGTNRQNKAKGIDAIAIGAGAITNGDYAIAIGPYAEANKKNQLVLGTASHEVNIPGIVESLRAKSANIDNANISDSANIQGKLTAGEFITDELISKNNIHYLSFNNGSNSVAIGNEASSSNNNSVAIGTGANSAHENSVAIGTGAQTTGKKQIVLGDASTTVVIPGHLAVQDALIYGGYEERNSGGKNFGNGDQTKSCGLMYFSDHYADDNEYAKGTYVRRIFTTRNSIGKNGLEASKNRQVYVPDWAKNIIIKDGKTFNSKGELEKSSDRRLKNVGEKFTSGLEQIKKLDLYNFTFKADKAKTPQVGVMAQDLQKVFPNAVWKGEDGYLRIRWDEMFYAVINAVKELDAKITTAFEQIKANTDKVAKLQAQVDEQKQEISELKAQNAEFEKRLAKLEKKAK